MLYYSFGRGTTKEKRGGRKGELHRSNKREKASCRGCIMGGGLVFGVTSRKRGPEFHRVSSKHGQACREKVPLPEGAEKISGGEAVIPRPRKNSCQRERED